MKAGTDLLGNPDDAVSEKPAMQNNGARLTPMTLRLLGFCFEPSKNADSHVAVSVCAACRLSLVEREKRYNHHVSYSQNWTVPVHTSCHWYIHNSNKYPHLKPPDDELNEYRGKKREQNRKYRQANKDKINERRRLWRQANSDKEREYNQRYIQANKDKINERRRLWRQANSDKEREYNQRYIQANKDKINERRRLWRQANSDKEREYNQRYIQANKDKINERRRLWRQANQ